jgi:GT2 family glycosyltransferase
MSQFDHASIRQVGVVMGAFMLIRRKVFETVGLFDEDYFMYAEETDFCYRARQLGYSTFFFPEASVIHLGGGSAQDSQKYFDQLHSALLLFLQKHFTGIRLLAALALKNLGVALRVAIYFLIGLLTLDFRLIRKAKYYFRVLF